MALWLNVAMPAVLYGCEFVPFSQTAILEIERQQSMVGKFNLGLPSNAPNISTTVILGAKPFKQLLYSSQLRYLVKLFKQDKRRWSKDAFIDHLEGGWPSPYIKYMGDIRHELGMPRWPGSAKEVNLCLESHFQYNTNIEIGRLSLPALEPVAKRARMSHVNESKESQVTRNIFNLFFRLYSVRGFLFASLIYSYSQLIALSNPISRFRDLFGSVVSIPHIQAVCRDFPDAGLAFWRLCMYPITPGGMTRATM